MKKKEESVMRGAYFIYNYNFSFQPAETDRQSIFSPLSFEFHVEYTKNCHSILFTLCVLFEFVSGLSKCQPFCGK